MVCLVHIIGKYDDSRIISGKAPTFVETTGHPDNNDSNTDIPNDSQ
jgi:hypothetical protein